MTTTPSGESDPAVSEPTDVTDHTEHTEDTEVHEIRVFLLTDSDVLAQEGKTSLWRSVARPVEDAPAGPTPAQLRKFKRMHPAYQGRLSRADGIANPPAAAPAARKMEIYDPLTSSWSAVPPGAGRAQVGEAVCCILPDGRFLVGSVASASCATYDPGTNCWSTAPIPARSGTSRRSGGPASVIVVRMSN
jgi:hypothetical protein